jgi:two-component system, OmpR family, response regulator
MMAYRVLVVDDDPHILDVLRFALQKAGHDITSVATGETALHALSTDRHDLVVLDIGLPDIDGLEICRRIRKTSDIPILFLSARDDEIDRILGLELGADDYVTKPFSPREIVARVHTILKRTKRILPVIALTTTLSKGALVLNIDEHSATWQGNDVILTGIEFSILKTLLKRPTMVFNREQILDLAYSNAIAVSDRTIDSHIRNLRSKFAGHGCQDLIDTVHGVGFRMGNCKSSVAVAATKVES